VVNYLVLVGVWATFAVVSVIGSIINDRLCELIEIMKKEDK